MRYNTNQREKILEYLKEHSSEHVTPDSIISHFQAIDEPIGKATVYRYLDYLVENNVVRKYVTSLTTSACYQIIGNDHKCKEHYHFKCNSCGELFHVDCDFMDEISEHVFKDHGFVIDSSKTVFYGLCEKCR